MNSHRAVWTTCLGSLAAVGAGVAVVASPLSAVWLFVMASLVSGIAAASALGRLRPEPPSRRRRLWSAARWGGAGGLYLLALVGLDMVLPVWLMAAVIALSLGLLAAGGLRMYRRSTGAEPAAAADHADHADHSGQVARTDPGDPADANADERRLHHASLQAQAMSTLELCEAWPATFAELERCTDPVARVWIVTRRQLYLDELERRDPAAVRAWLGSHARAANNPRRFLTRTEDGRR